MLKAKLETSSIKSKLSNDEPSSSQGARPKSHDFIRDRIARRKEAEDLELGQVENEGAGVVQPDDLSTLTAEDVAGLFSQSKFVKCPCLMN